MMARRGDLVVVEELVTEHGLMGVVDGRGEQIIILLTRPFPVALMPVI